jgi:hypothetical protein
VFLLSLICTDVELHDRVYGNKGREVDCCSSKLSLSTSNVDWNDGV